MNNLTQAPKLLTKKQYKVNKKKKISNVIGTCAFIMDCSDAQSPCEDQEDCTDTTDLVKYLQIAK